VIGLSTFDRIEPGRASVLGVAYGVSDVNKASRFFGPPDQIFIGAPAFRFSDISNDRTSRLNNSFSLEFIRSHGEGGGGRGNAAPSELRVGLTSIPRAPLHSTLVYRLTYNDDVAAGQLGVFQGASDEHI
jgi:hypothetical protein